MSDYQPLIKLAEDLVKAHMANYDPSHDWLHVDRVRRTALALARDIEKSGPGSINMLVVELAALFHDLADHKYTPKPSAPSSASPHNADSPSPPLSPLDTLLHPFFNSPLATQTCFPTGLSSPLALLINSIVTSTSYSLETRLRAQDLWSSTPSTAWRADCKELWVVQDADRLDAIGAMGIMRCSAYSAVVGRPLFVEEDEEGRKGSAIGHFEEKLFKLKDGMKTPLGKQLAKSRHSLMVRFAEAAEEEFAVLM